MSPPSDLGHPLIPAPERRRLLAVARRAVVSSAANGRVPDLFALASKPVRRCGVFVTLRMGGRLRGCIGTPESPHTLEQTVARCAGLAALEDPRFTAMRPEEVAAIEIEISVLSPAEPVRPEEIEVGRHGLVVSRGAFRGLLLPQVAQEYSWDRETFLAETCRKAGLELEAWKDPETRLEAFSAEIFSEADFLDTHPAGDG